VFVFEQYTESAACDLNRFVLIACVFVREHARFSEIPRSDRRSGFRLSLRRNSDVASPKSLFRNCEENVYGLLRWRKVFSDRPRRRCVVNVRDIERFSIRHNADTLRQTKLTIFQCFSIDAQIRDAPVGIMRRRKTKLDFVFKKLILSLEML